MNGNTVSREYGIPNTDAENYCIFLFRVTVQTYINIRPKTQVGQWTVMKSLIFQVLRPIYVPDTDLAQIPNLY